MWGGGAFWKLEKDCQCTPSNLESGLCFSFSSEVISCLHGGKLVNGAGILYQVGLAVTGLGLGSMQSSELEVWYDGEWGILLAATALSLKETFPAELG